MSPSQILPSIFILILLTISFHVSAFNITEILNLNPDLSEFNTYLTRTKLADDINSRKTITVLAVSNSAISAISGISTAAIKSILSIHILLDYFDDVKLHDLKIGTTTTTTLYQTTGVAEDQTGQVNITVSKGGEVGFTSAQPGSKPGPKFVKDIRTFPSTYSVVQISELITVKSLLTTGEPDVNVTAVLEKGGCNTFVKMISESGVLKTFLQHLSSESGITIFAPTDDAFNATGLPKLSDLSKAELVSLLLYHALGSYAPISTLKSKKGDLKTLASGGNYGLTVTTAGDSVRLHTGVDNSRLTATLIDKSPVAIYAVDSVLLPEALFGNSTSPTQAPTPASDAPTPSKPPSPAADAPSPSSSPYASPPAPPSENELTADGGSDDGGPTASDDGNDDENHKNGAVKGNVSLLMSVVLLVIYHVISFVV